MNGADKPLLPLARKALIGHVIDRVRPQVDALLINANGELARFAAFGLPVVRDAQTGFLGPIAGILAGFEWVATNLPSTEWLVSLPCDCPLLPVDLAQKLISAAEQGGAQVAVAASAGRRHHVVAAWSMKLPLNGDNILTARGIRKAGDFVESFRHVQVEFPAFPYDPFFNVNTPEDAATAEELMSGQAHV
jgi:molybdopterin-guanine dinucleotide biosynthesis protein A